MDEDKLKEEDWLKEVSRSIGEQIEAQGEFDKEDETGVSEESESDEIEEKKKWSTKKKLLLAGGILGVLVFIGAAALIGINYMLDRVNVEKESEVVFAPSDLTDDELKNQPTVSPKIFDEKVEQQVINILLIGVEAINDNIGRSDSMMIATINQADKSLKLTSLMRDCFVSIPGYKDNKLNAAYNNGGGVLLAQTIEHNFDIKIDGYVKVDFAAFEDIVDKLGGVTMDISSSEAAYLNSTNYISNRANRTIKTGVQTLNGNQALGYCRVRYRKTPEGEANDFGRTLRQRKVLTAIFDKYKSTNVVNMVSIATDMLGYVTTNLNKQEMISYFATAAGLGTTELETMRIPVDNGYTDGSVYCGNQTKKSDVLLLDFEENKRAIHEFIYSGTSEATKYSPADTENESSEEQETTTAGQTAGQ